MSKRIHIETISELHDALGYEKPKHPMITLLDMSKINEMPIFNDMILTTGFYTISYKIGSVCDLHYGRKRCDFTEGSLFASAPGREGYYNGQRDRSEIKGWMLCFHPDLFHGSALANGIHQYSFFSYSQEEALQLSHLEKEAITNIVRLIEQEYSMNLDGFSNKLLLSNLETLLNYCGRYYSRQFITRSGLHSDTIRQFLLVLNERFEQSALEHHGIPTVIEFADLMGYSQYYLTDLLKKETGKGTQEFIHDKIITKAKELLGHREYQVSDVAYVLGYDYPEHFSRFFKKKVGLSPLKYRKTLEGNLYES